MAGQRRLMFRWWRWALVVVLLAASCFVQYLSSAFAYSAQLGLSSMAQQAQRSERQALVFFGLFLGLEVFSTYVVASSWEKPDLGSAWLQFLTKYGLAFGLSILMSSIMFAVWLTIVLHG